MPALLAPEELCFCFVASSCLQCPEVRLRMPAFGAFHFHGWHCLNILCGSCSCFFGFFDFPDCMHSGSCFLASAGFAYYIRAHRHHYCTAFTEFHERKRMKLAKLRVWLCFILLFPISYFYTYRIFDIKSSNNVFGHPR